jgi:uncharacterized membrane protein YfcA
MPSPKTVLLATLLIITVGYSVLWAVEARRRRSGGRVVPTATGLGTGFVTNFFDTLGIGSFATTTSIYRLLGIVRDENIPGTLNVGHTWPTFFQALIYVTIVEVDFKTLSLLIAAAVIGSWLGASVVASWPRRNIQVGMGAALLVAAGLMVMSALGLAVPAGSALALTGTKLQAGIAINFLLGALMTLGIGLYAPCLIMISLLGMDPKAAFPIMMGSCAFLMPVCSVKFIRKEKYDLRAALGLAIGGIPAVLIAALIVKSLPIQYVRWLVVLVVVYTSTTMLRSAMTEAAAARAKASPAL